MLSEEMARLGLTGAQVQHLREKDGPEGFQRATPRQWRVRRRRKSKAE